jgi:hypothetical protein
MIEFYRLRTFTTDLATQQITCDQFTFATSTPSRHYADVEILSRARNSDRAC